LVCFFVLFFSILTLTPLIGHCVQEIILLQFQVRCQGKAKLCQALHTHSAYACINFDHFTVILAVQKHTNSYVIKNALLFSTHSFIALFFYLFND